MDSSGDNMTNDCKSVAAQLRLLHESGSDSPTGGSEHVLSSTPGGTLYATSPGGTRLVYDRAFILRCRDSPLSRTPPPNLAHIPGVTSPSRAAAPHNTTSTPSVESDARLPSKQAESHSDDSQFDMDV